MRTPKNSTQALTSVRLCASLGIALRVHERRDPKPAPTLAFVGTQSGSRREGLAEPLKGRALSTSLPASPPAFFFLSQSGRMPESPRFSRSGRFLWDPRQTALLLDSLDVSLLPWRGGSGRRGNSSMLCGPHHPWPWLPVGLRLQAYCSLPRPHGGPPRQFTALGACWWFVGGAMHHSPCSPRLGFQFGLLVIFAGPSDKPQFF